MFWNAFIRIIMMETYFFSQDILYFKVYLILPTVLLSFPACPRLFGPSIVVLASSNQRLAIHHRLIIMRAAWDVRPLFTCFIYLSQKFLRRKSYQLCWCTFKL